MWASYTYHVFKRRAGLLKGKIMALVYLLFKKQCSTKELKNKAVVI